MTDKLMCVSGPTFPCIWETAKKDYLNTVSYPQLWDNSVNENIPNENFTLIVTFTSYLALGTSNQGRDLN